MKTSDRERHGSFRRAMLLALLILPLGAASLAADFRGIVFFGDSLSDPGNHFVAFGTSAKQPFEPIPSDSYALGGHHFSNGATWAEDLAGDLGLPTSGGPALRSPGVFTNYAVGRARARPGATTFSEFDLTTQVARFLSDFGGAAPSDFLYVVWIGSNDLTDALGALSIDPSGTASQTILQQALEAVAGNVSALWAAGARTFLVPNLPNPAITPFVRSLGPQAQGAAWFLSSTYNQLLETAVLPALGALPESLFLPLDPDAVFAEVFADAQGAGLTNVAEPCLTFGVQAKTFCAAPQRYLFWDGIHPTKTGHRLLADAALEAIAAWEGDAP